MDPTQNNSRCFFAFVKQILPKEPPAWDDFHNIATHASGLVSKKKSHNKLIYNKRFAVKKILQGRVNFKLIYNKYAKILYNFIYLIIPSLGIKVVSLF